MGFAHLGHEVKKMKKVTGVFTADKVKACINCRLSVVSFTLGTTHQYGVMCFDHYFINQSGHKTTGFYQCNLILVFR